MANIIIYCADIGSVKKNNFAWARLPETEPIRNTLYYQNIHTLVESVTEDIIAGSKVALGFECPLFVPISENPIDLTSAREGEENRPWSAAAGACAMATGLTESVWILEQVKMRLSSQNKKLPKAFLDWNNFLQADSGLIIWEAFVSGKQKNDGKTSHYEDALLAAQTFEQKWQCDQMTSDIQCKSLRSLIGAALLQTGWTDDISVLSQPCLVVKGKEFK